MGFHLFADAHCLGVLEGLTNYLRLFKEPQTGQLVENKDIDVHHRKENMFLRSSKNINHSEGTANAMFAQDMSFMYQFPCTMPSIK